MATVALPGFAQSQFTDLFKLQGVPEAATRQALEYLSLNAGSKAVHGVTVQSDFMAIIDFSKASTEKRLYLMDLNNGHVDAFLVAHGRNSGVRLATKFRNTANSKSTSLGMALTGEVYSGFYGRSMRLYGVDKSNSSMEDRLIVLHAAPYATPEFIEKNGRLGRSWGCFAVETSTRDTLQSKLKAGSLIYAYHPDLLDEAVVHPAMQILADPSVVDDKEINLPGEEDDIRAQNPR
jgi:hypothetical protein